MTFNKKYKNEPSQMCKPARGRKKCCKITYIVGRLITEKLLTSGLGTWQI